MTGMTFVDESRGVSMIIPDSPLAADAYPALRDYADQEAKAMLAEWKAEHGRRPSESERHALSKHLWPRLEKRSPGFARAILTARFWCFADRETLAWEAAHPGDAEIPEAEQKRIVQISTMLAASCCNSWAR